MTLSSVFEKGKPAAARIRLAKEGKDGPGKLVYEEASLRETYIRYEADQPEYGGTITLYPDVTRVTIRYYGAWEYQFLPARQDFFMVYKWQKTFSGRQRSAVPVTIEMTVETPKEKLKLVFHVKIQNLGKGLLFNPEIG